MVLYFNDFIENHKLKFKKLENGVIIAKAQIARVGVQNYMTPNGLLRVLRNEAAVLDSVDSMNMLPVTLNHPSSGMLTSDNAKELVVGSTGSDARLMPNGFIKSSVSILTQDAVDAIENSGYKEFSVGYTAVLEFEQGEWCDNLGVMGEKGVCYEFDAKMTNIEGNHLALVKEARAGRDATFVDSSNIYLNIINDIQESVMKKEAVEVTDNAVDSTNQDSSQNTLIDSLNAKVDLLTSELDAIKSKSNVNANDKENEYLAKINELETKLQSVNDSIAKEVEDRISLWKQVNDSLGANLEVNYSLSTTEIKKQYLGSRYPKMQGRLSTMDSVDDLWELMIVISDSTPTNE
ncbi:MAG: DUF2213 domain-containing protein, partial [Waterburya sp.]